MVEGTGVLKALDRSGKAVAGGLERLPVHDDVANAKPEKARAHPRIVVGIERGRDPVGGAACIGSVEDRMLMHLLVERVGAGGDLLSGRNDHDRVLDQDPGGLGFQPQILVRRREDGRRVGWRLAVELQGQE